jgi:hypothetical protein
MKELAAVPVYFKVTNDYAHTRLSHFLVDYLIQFVSSLGSDLTMFVSPLTLYMELIVALRQSSFRCHDHC